MTDAAFILNIALAGIVILFFLINKSCIVILLVSMAGINTKRRSRFTFNLDQVFKLEPLPPVSNHVTACNEEKAIVESSIRQSSYDNCLDGGGGARVW